MQVCAISGGARLPFPQAGAQGLCWTVRLSARHISGCVRVLVTGLKGMSVSQRSPASLENSKAGFGTVTLYWS